MSKKPILFFLVSMVSIFLLSLAAGGAETNLVQNPGFEEIKDGLPLNWYSDVFPSGGADFTVEKTGVHSGSSCAAIINKKESDAKLIQEVNVQRNKVYKISCFIKVEKIKKSTGGANISVLNGTYSSREIFDTGRQWQPIEVYVRTGNAGPDVLKLAVRLGGFGALNEGTAFFDDLKVELVENPDPGLTIADLVAETATGGGGQFSGSNDGHKTGTAFFNQPQTLFYILVGLVVIGFLVFIELKMSRRAKNSDSDSSDDEG